MTATRPAISLAANSVPAGIDSDNGRHDPRHEHLANARLVLLWTRFGPYVVSLILLLLGYLHYAPGTAYSLSEQHYRAWSFPAFRYSDLIWLYLRDALDRRPLPYVDYPLEYPPLTGLVSWLLSWSPDLPVYFTLAYTLLAASALLTVWALQQMGGANAWLFAASPALFFYTGHQWDMVAIGVAAAALLALQRGRAGWGIAGLVIATSLKLFPVVFVVGAVVERIRDRRYRSAAAISLAFAAGTLVINVPVALKSFEGWSFFFRWNRDRLADSGIWVLWRDVPTEDLTRWSLVAALAGGLALTTIAFRSRGPIAIPLGATYLLWWLLVNKTFTTHLILWAFFSIALLSAPWWMWGLMSAVDLIGFQLGNYLNLYNVPRFQSAPLIRKAVENIYDPVQIARSAVLLVATLWGVRVLREEAFRASYAGTVKTLRVCPEAKHQPVTRSGATADRFTPRHGLLRGAGVTLAFAAATILMTWPYAENLSNATVVGFDPYPANLVVGMDPARAHHKPVRALRCQHLLPVRADPRLHRRQRSGRTLRRATADTDRRPGARKLASRAGDVRSCRRGCLYLDRLSHRESRGGVHRRTRLFLPPLSHGPSLAPQLAGGGAAAVDGARARTTDRPALRRTRLRAWLTVRDNRPHQLLLLSPGCTDRRDRASSPGWSLPGGARRTS